MDIIYPDFKTKHLLLFSLSSFIESKHIFPEILECIQSFPYLVPPVLFFFQHYGYDMVITVSSV